MPVLVVGFDGLRPDMVTADTMPVLSDFLDSAFVYRQAVSIFPSETRVAASSLATGCYPDKHGLAGNFLYVPEMDASSMLNTGKADILDALERARGALLGVPSLGKILADRGKRLAVASSGSPGSCRLLHHQAANLGGYRFSFHGPEHCASPEQFAEAENLLGPVPSERFPDAERSAYLARLATEIIMPSRPDAAVIWFTDPDSTGHFRGLGTPAYMSALSTVDKGFGQILDAARQDAAKGVFWSILTVSDHGHIPLYGCVDIVETLNQDAKSLLASLEKADVRFAARPGNPANAAVKPGRPTEMFLPVLDPGLHAELCAYLAALPWVSALVDNSPHPSPLALDAALVRARHPAAPLLRVLPITCREERFPPLRALGAASENHTKQDGRTPSVFYPALGGPDDRRRYSSHGGLSSQEMSILLAGNGPEINPGVTNLPSGLVDIAPTICSRIGIPVPEHMDGRALFAESPETSFTEDVYPVPGGMTRLRIRSVDGKKYPTCLEHG